MKNLFYKVFFPYCLQRSDNNGYFILNRDYKPLSFFIKEHVTYEDYPIKARMSITKSMAMRLAWDGSDRLDMIFLYSDSTIPTDSKNKMESYLDKLALLGKLKVEEDISDERRFITKRDGSLEKIQNLIKNSISSERSLVDELLEERKREHELETNKD